ncbi:MAG: glycosidase, partial [Myxococcota bacterium]
LVASGGPDNTLTFTGWSLRESGQGNHWNVLGGFTALFGNIQIAPNFLYQRPIEEALPNIPGAVDPVTGRFFPGVTPRNIIDDPFSVRGNQEMAAYELLVVWDPTPATFFWQFDNRAQEDSPMSLGLDLVYRDFRGVQDAGIGVLADQSQFAFDGSVPEEDLFEASLQARGKIDGVRYSALIYGGEGQPNGDDDRVVQRFGVNYELSYKRMFLQGFIKIDDWGPYDFHRDFNFTFPLQTMVDVSYGATLPSWLYEGYTRIGVRTQWRLLNDLSPRTRLDELAPRQTRLFSNLGDGDNLGYELEVLTYLNITL